MPGFGGGGIDIRSLFGSVLNVLRGSKANQVCASTCDGLVLRMHYRWTFLTLLGGFLTIWSSWYYRDVITCVSHFNAETQVRLDYINVCLSYPYIEIDGARRYLLYYRWISWSLLLLAGFYYIPRKVSKSQDNTRCKKLLEDLAVNAFRYDQAEKELLDRAVRYLVFNLRTHDGLYWKYLAVNALSLFIDVFAMYYLNFILQGRFIGYGYNSYPFQRDMETFSDYMSQTFPPFVMCELSTPHLLTNKRTERLGCHLTVMELYEKVFLGLWLWLIFQTFITICYIVFLFLMKLPRVQLYLLRCAKPRHAQSTVSNVIENVCKNCKIGDIYLLYRIKSHVSHARFYELMSHLSDPSLSMKNLKNGQPAPTTVVPEIAQTQIPPGMQPDTLRNRIPTAPQNPDPSLSQGYLNQIFANPGMMGPPQQQQPRQKNPKGNTSILIE